MHYVSLTLLVCVCITSSPDVDVSHPKCKTHRVTPRRDTDVALVCFPSWLKPMVGMHVPSLALIHTVEYSGLSTTQWPRNQRTHVPHTPRGYIVDMHAMYGVPRQTAYTYSYCECCHTPPSSFTVHYNKGRGRIGHKVSTLRYGDFSATL
jgi:hypothetical protein